MLEVLLLPAVASGLKFVGDAFGDGDGNVAGDFDGLIGRVTVSSSL